MNESKIVADVQALTTVSTTVKTFNSNLHELYEEFVRMLKLNGSEWNDEDFNKLVSAMKSFEAELEQIDEHTQLITKETDAKIDKINQLHNLKL